ncbi:MAG: hypothetical protein M5U19_00730 [Microthrixaceae bacterium]|nr:hypothetical protein [Microthrixaceae bacterium]
MSAGSVSLSVPVVGGESWLVLRAADSGNYWRFGQSGGSYELQQIRGWWFGSAVVSRHATVLPADGDELSCDVGSVIACSVNGTLVASTSDAFNASSTREGFATGASGSAPVTRFR